ncbi:transposase [Vibrio agarivorans]
MIKGIFSLPLSALQGFIDSIFTLMNVPLRSPNYTSISMHLKTVPVKYRFVAQFDVTKSRSYDVID